MGVLGGWCGRYWEGGGYTWIQFRGIEYYMYTFMIS